jgi:hypothetical protein
LAIAVCAGAIVMVIFAGYIGLVMGVLILSMLFLLIVIRGWKLYYTRCMKVECNEYVQNCNGPQYLVFYHGLHHPTFIVAHEIDNHNVLHNIYHNQNGKLKRTGSFSYTLGSLYG